MSNKHIVLEETNNNEVKEERLQISIEEYNYVNYISYINRKEVKEEKETPRVIIIDLWYNFIKKGKKWV